MIRLLLLFIFFSTAYASCTDTSVSIISNGFSTETRGEAMFADSPVGEYYSLSYKDCQNEALSNSDYSWYDGSDVFYIYSSSTPFGCNRVSSTGGGYMLYFNWFPSPLFCNSVANCLKKCTYTKVGCTDSTKSNYDPDADYDDESCSDCDGMEIKTRGYIELFDNTKPAGFYSISQSECEQHKIDNGGYSFTVYATAPVSLTSSKPKGCSRYTSTYSGRIYYYFNTYEGNTNSPTSCSNKIECIGACYTKAGCTDNIATNYVSDADYPVNSECTYFFPNPEPVVATCSDTSSSSWCYYFTERDSIGDENTQYMTIQKRAARDCAFDPTTDDLDFSTIDTQGLALYIGKNAFYNCKTFTSITFPDNVDIIIGYDAFYSTNLNSLTVTNRMRIMRNGFRSSPLNSLTFESGWNYPLRGFANLGGTITSFTVPPNVTEIDSHAFENANNLETLILNEGLLTIGSSAFTGTKITSITIPSTVTAIDSNAFQNNNDLETLILNEGLLTIGSSAFTGTKITSITIPSTVTNFQGSSFENSDSSVNIEFTFLSDSITIDNRKYIFPPSGLTHFSCGELKTEFINRNCDCDSINR